jgi:orotate phosphoribosyltransferase
MRDDLIDLLSVRSGHFRLESGHHGDLWLELDLLFLRPARLRPFVEELAGLLAGHRIQAVCGPLTGGALVAQMIAATLDAGFAYAERVASPGRDLFATGYRVPDSLQPSLSGRRVAIVDDAINAGSAVRGTLAALRRCEAEPVALGALLVLGDAPADLAATQSLPLAGIAHLPAHLWTPPECPLCAAGMPLE